jgi:hypothetical protein
MDIFVKQIEPVSGKSPSAISWYQHFVNATTA